MPCHQPHPCASPSAGLRHFAAPGSFARAPIARRCSPPAAAAPTCSSRSSRTSRHRSAGLIRAPIGAGLEGGGEIHLLLDRVDQTPGLRISHQEVGGHSGAAGRVRDRVPPGWQQPRGLPRRRSGRLELSVHPGLGPGGGCRSRSTMGRPRRRQQPPRLLRRQFRDRRSRAADPRLWPSGRRHRSGDARRRRKRRPLQPSPWLRWRRY